MKPEGIVENYLRSQCEKKGYLCYKWVSPGRRGVPDDIVIGNGKIILVECKGAGGHLSEIQKLIISRIEKQGIPVYVPFTKSDIDEILSKLEQ